MLSAAAPLASTAGGTSTGWAVTGVTQIPLAFVVTAVLLLVFVVGYTAMSRHVTSAGALYTYVARGLGPVTGISAAFVALVSYAAMQIGLFGGIGAVAASFFNPRLGSLPMAGHPPWWVYGAPAWVLVLIFGRLRVDFNSRVLGVLMGAECLVMIIFDAIMLAHPHGGHLSTDTLAPSGLAKPAISVAVVIAFTSFVGVEDTTNYSEESRPGTLGKAMRVSILVGACIYALSAWSMSVATGPDQVVGEARQQGSELMFNLVGASVGTTMVDVGHLLFLTSLFASCLSFHNTVSRYLFAMGREGVLPRALGITSRRTGTPKNASLCQSGIAAVVLVVAAVSGWDPMVQMFFWMGTLAGVGVAVLMCLASIAVLGFFARDPHGEPLTHRVVFPALAALALGAVVVLTLDHYAILLGVTPGAPVARLLPGVLVLAAAVGLIRGAHLYVRRDRPDAAYHHVGLGYEIADRPTTHHPVPPTTPEGK
ncbi:APC family permease [Actinomadura rubrisoli]|uniref:APC family permease n=1 Tax=Actinomadura rubrisoli TaxID=2530368 RepID=UPI001FB82037|nr:APC family permease [Actinomadura rubrisoli]